MIRAIYSARLALFIHGITSAKKMREVRPAALISEGNMLVVKYSLDTQVRYSTLKFTDFQGSIEALNFLIITS
jgi:hypothetical protein